MRAKNLVKTFCWSFEKNFIDVGVGLSPEKDQVVMTRIQAEFKLRNFNSIMSEIFRCDKMKKFNLKFTAISFARSTF